MDRVKAFQFITYAAAAIIIARLFYWQFLANVTTNSDAFAQESKIPASRGEIYASDGFPIVTNQEAFLLFGQPNELGGDSKTVAQKLAPFLISEKYSTSSAMLSEDEQKQKDEEIKNEEQSLIQKLSDKKLFWVQLARKIPMDIKARIDGLSIKGLDFERDTKRFYPEASMGAQLLGFVGSDKFGDDTGYFGLEGYYDSKLRGQDGKLGEEKDPFGFPILVGKYRSIAPKKGDSLYLTIDRTIQYIVEKRLNEDVKKYGAKDGSVIIADPKTGNILAMATYPNYNPALFSEFTESDFKNPAVSDAYEPGSTFKLIAMSAALDLSLVDPNTRCDVCSGPRQIGDYQIETWNKQYRPNSTMAEVIQHSDNIGMTFVADKLGVDRFYDYIKKFGFGSKTGIDLQGEIPGLVRQKDEWRPIDLATASFGQGIAVTPIQMVQAVQVIAGGGKLISPKIVDKIVENGKEIKVQPQTERQVVSQKTAALMTEMMVNAVAKGEAQAFAPKGYSIAGKTGTAQIPVAGHYDPTKTIASFVGFAPSDNPRFVMLVRFTEPTSSIFGAETAAPTFFGIAKDIFNYLAISPNSN